MKVHTAKSISAVVPMYNEEECAAEIIAALRAGIAPLTADYEIIVVNDHSTDSTLKIVRDAMRECPAIRIIDNPGVNGLGNALKAGFAAAGKELVLYTDADLPCDPGEIARAVRLCAEHDADIVSAFRANPFADGLRRRVYTIAYNFLVNSSLRTGMQDINFAFKLFKREKLQELRINAHGSFVNAELFSKDRQRKFRIVQFPAKYLVRRKGSSKLDSIGNIVEIMREFFAYLKNIREAGKRHA